MFEAFYPRRGYGYKLKDGKQAISELKKLGVSSELLADLMLFYVETGVQFTNDFGDINEAFYLSMGSTYLATLKHIEKEDLLAKFSDCARKVVDNTIDTGWGFHDYLCEVYCQFYDDE